MVSRPDRPTPLWRLVLLCLVLVHAPLLWAGVVQLPGSGVAQEVKRQALVRADPGAELDPEQLLRSDAGFRPFSPDLDRQAERTWLRLELRADGVGDGRHVLRVARRFFTDFEVFIQDADGAVQRHVLTAGQAPQARTVGREFVIDFDVRPGTASTLLVRAQTAQGSLRPVEVRVQDATGFARLQARTYLFFGLVFGVLGALIFHNLVLYLNLRQRGHLYYVAAMVALLAMLAVDSGMAQNYLMPATMRAHEGRIHIALVGLMLASIALFFQVFVDSARVLPRLTRLVRVLATVIATLAILQLFLPMGLFVPAVVLVQVASGVALVTLILGGILAGRRGVPEGWFFSAAWGLLALSNLVRTLLTLDLAGRSFVLEYLLYFGAVAEASILSLGLAWRVRELRSRHARALREQHEAARLANLDALTGVYNRRFLQSYLGNLLADGNPRSRLRPVLILDLDHFKEANDTFGHAAGDAVLKGLVERCRRVLREGDVLSRLGGDEFVVVLADRTDRSGQEVGARILAEIARDPFTWEGQPVPVTTSIGIVAEVPAGASPGQVLRMADQALYQAKQAGRNRTVLYDPDTATPFRHGTSLPHEPEKQA